MASFMTFPSNHKTHTPKINDDEMKTKALTFDAIIIYLPTIHKRPTKEINHTQGKPNFIHKTKFNLSK